MAELEDHEADAATRGILPDALVTVVSIQWFGSETHELINKDLAGRVANTPGSWWCWRDSWL